MPDYSAEETFGSIEAAIGDYLNIDSVAYQVVGVLESMVIKDRADAISLLPHIVPSFTRALIFQKLWYKLISLK